MKNAASTLLVAASLFVSFASARAQDGYAPPPPPPPQMPPPPMAVAAPQPLAPGVGEDPNVDRAILLPTAMTQPAGSVTYNNYELLLHGITYGVTDNIQTTFTVLAPITKDIPLLGFASVKGQLAVGDRLHLALQGTLGFATASTGNSSSVVTLGGGAFASVCLTEDCTSLLSASALYELSAWDSSSSDSARVLIYGGSLAARLTPHVKLLAEVTSGAAMSNNDSTNLPGALFSYALRFHTGAIAGDVGFIKPIGKDLGGDSLLLGLPFVSFSYRWM
jgi:hypothetical protein